MIVLITGVAGFIGSHIATHYLENGDYVIGMDDFSSSSRTSSHFSKLLLYSKFHFQECDITVNNYLHTTMFPSVIFNFACPASPLNYQKLPMHTFDTCTVGMKNVLDYAVQHKATVIQASSSEVYGEPSVIPQSETCFGNANSFGPRSMYSEGKRAAETLCWIYRHKYGLKTRIARIFNTYGPHMDIDDGRVITNFIRQALNNKPLTVFGSKTRSFCYISDLIQALIKMPSWPYDGRPINLGNEFEISIEDLAHRIINATGSESEIVIGEDRLDDPNRRCPDITLAKDILNWSPTIGLRDGIRLTVEYIKKEKP